MSSVVDVYICSTCVNSSLKYEAPDILTNQRESEEKNCKGEKKRQKKKQPIHIPKAIVINKLYIYTQLTSSIYIYSTTSHYNGLKCY